MNKLSRIGWFGLVVMANAHASSSSLLPVHEPEHRLILGDTEECFNAGKIVVHQNSQFVVRNKFLNFGEITICSGASIAGAENIINIDGGIVVYQQDEPTCTPNVQTSPHDTSSGNM